MIKLSKEELLEHLDFWKIKCKSFWNRIDNRAYTQIVAIIQKPQVTEEWIEERAKELFRKEKAIISLNWARDFIRSLVGEMK